MKEIIVKSQKELDKIPVDFDGQIIIKFGTPYNRAVVNRCFRYRVVARGNSSVVAWGNSSVVARGNSSVEAWGNSSVEAWGNSSVEAWENSSVVAWGNSLVVAWGNSSVEAWGNSSVEAWGNSLVVAWENSSVVARGNSSVVARGNSSVEGDGNSQITDSTDTHKISVSGNSRIVYNPRNISEYIDFYNITRAENKVLLYKAVHKRDGRFLSDHNNNFEYIIGEIAVADKLTTRIDEICGHGIHMAYKEWCVDYGRDWDDLAILEVEADISEIVVPVNGNGKIRAKQAKIIREIPVEECGISGKIYAKKHQKKGEK